MPNDISLSDLLAAYRAAKPQIDADYRHKCIVFGDGKGVGNFDTQQEGEKFQREHFARRCSILQQAGVPGGVLIESAMYATVTSQLRPRTFRLSNMHDA